jgi:hypothetical protein
LELRRVFKLAKPGLNLHEHVLQNILRRRRVSHPRADELTQLDGEFVPDVFESRRHRSLTVLPLR